jgi:hypothetical protein
MGEAMNVAGRVLVAATLILLGGCASNPKVVRQIMADATGCDKTSVDVIALDDNPAGVEHFEVSGCGVTHRYACRGWTRSAMETIEETFPHVKNCYRESR